MRSWINRLARMALVPAFLAMLPSALPQETLFPASGPPMEVVKVRLPDYNPDGTLKSVMFGDKALIEGHVFTITNLRVELYEKEQLVTTFWAESCRYDKDKDVLDSDSPVRVTRPGLVITGDGLDWKKGESVVVLRRNVRVVMAGGAEWFKVEKKK